MATIIQFSPSTSSNFTFQAEFDGQSYTITCPWNLYGQRYYLKIEDLSGNIILNCPLIPSPNGYDINLIKGYFTTSTLVFRDASQQFEIVP